MNTFWLATSGFPPLPFYQISVSFVRRAIWAGQNRVSRACDSGTESSVLVLFGTVSFYTQFAAILENGLREVGMSPTPESA